MKTCLLILCQWLDTKEGKHKNDVKSFSNFGIVNCAQKASINNEIKYVNCGKTDTTSNIL